MKTILIVEDVELNRELLVQLLEEDHRLVFAEDGVSRARTRRRDSSRPDPDGSVAAAHGRLGSHAPAEGRPGDSRGIPVIVLSAHAMHGDEERARASGCDDFLTKPIDETAVVPDAGEAPWRLTPALVLIVDDEPLNVDLLEQELDAAGYRTISAHERRRCARGRLRRASRT